MPSNRQTTVSPGMIATAVLSHAGVSRVGSSTALTCTSAAAAGAAPASASAVAQEQRMPAPHATTSSWSIIALSPCSSAWQWNT